MVHPSIESFFDPTTSTLTYLVHDGRRAVVIDPVWDYEPKSSRTSTRSAERVAAYLGEKGLTLDYAIDTHAHADHFSALGFFRDRFGARTVTGSRIGSVQAIFREIFHLGDALATDGSQFDVLLEEGDVLTVGDFQIRAMHTPGHTPAHMSWQIGDAVFLGDSLFTPDHGTARCDFPGGSAEELWRSVQRIYALPPETRLFVCHDYRPNGRAIWPSATVAEHRESNVQLSAKTTLEDFVAFRRRRDAELEAPALILPSIQVNLRAGRLPLPEANGISYLKIPVDAPRGGGC